MGTSTGARNVTLLLTQCLTNKKLLINYLKMSLLRGQCQPPSKMKTVPRGRLTRGLASLPTNPPEGPNRYMGKFCKVQTGFSSARLCLRCLPIPFYALYCCANFMEPVLHVAAPLLPCFPSYLPIIVFQSIVRLHQRSS